MTATGHFVGTGTGHFVGTGTGHFVGADVVATGTGHFVGRRVGFLVGLQLAAVVCAVTSLADVALRKVAKSRQMTSLLNVNILLKL